MISLLISLTFASCPNTETPFDSLVCADSRLNSLQNEFNTILEEVRSQGNQDDVLAELILKETKQKAICNNYECAKSWFDEQSKLLYSLKESQSKAGTNAATESIINSSADLDSTTPKEETNNYQTNQQSNSTENRGANVGADAAQKSASSIVDTASSSDRKTKEFTPKDIRAIMGLIMAILVIATLVSYLRDLIRKRKDSDVFTKSTAIGYGFAILGILCAGFGAIFTEYAVGAFILSIIPFLVFAHGDHTSCPSCHRWWARVHVDSEELDRWIETKTVNRVDHTRDRSGKILATHNRKEQVLVECRKEKLTYNCKYCNNVWHKIKTHKK